MTGMVGLHDYKYRMARGAAAMETAESERSDFEEVESQAVNVQVNDEEVFASIDDLQQHGIGAADIQKLRAAGICTIKVRMIYRGTCSYSSLGGEHGVEEVSGEG